MKAKHFLFGLLGLVVIAGCGGSVTSRGIAHIRAISAVTNPSRIDVFTDFDIVGSDLTNGEGVPYDDQPSGNLSVGVRQFGTSTTLASGNIAIDVNDKVTLIPYQTGSNTIGILGFLDGTAAPGATKFKARIVHVDRFVGAVDVYFEDPDADLADKTPILAGLNFEGSTGYLELDAGIQKEFILTQAGTKTPIGNALAITGGNGALHTILLLDNSGPALNLYND
jgi:hypothetical protein